MKSFLTKLNAAGEKLAAGAAQELLDILDQPGGVAFNSSFAHYEKAEELPASIKQIAHSEGGELHGDPRRVFAELSGVTLDILDKKQP